MTALIEFVKSNWSYILSSFFGVIALASIIVKITPNKKDDEVLGKILSFLDHISIAKTDRDKELIDLAKKIKGEESSN